VKTLFSTRLGPWLAVAVGWTLALTLACRLSAALPALPADEGVTGLLFGESRRTLSSGLYEKADLYFHKGSAHLEPRAITNDWIQTWRQALAPTIHAHTEGGVIAEIVPWLKLATAADPHNVDAFLVMSFWVGVGLNRPDLADGILAEARRLNPRDYRLPQEQGCLAIRVGRFNAAEPKLSAALSCWPAPLDAADRQALLDKAQMLVLLGLLDEQRGEAALAASRFKNTLAIFPDRAYIRQHLSLLESGQSSPAAAREQLAVLVHRTVDDACHDEDEHEHEAAPQGRLAPEKDRVK
jgi:tetratricopeptide (TPR) repeat protein